MTARLSVTPVAATAISLSSPSASSPDLAGTLVGVSPAIAEARELIAQVSGSRLPVLLEGETGTGKEVVARLIHASSRRDGAFVPVNVCAIAPTMFEDSMFGHVKGAFTGAAGDHPGHLAEANGGTLFLDEIGGLPLELQPKLLRAIELGTFRPVGAPRDRVSSFRIVAATNEPLATLTERGRFRLDLAFRIAGVIIRLPPLRDRPEDIAHLARHFMVAASDGRSIELQTSAVRCLEAHHWPGNVRELRSIVESALVLAGGGRIDGAAIGMLIGRGVSSEYKNSRREAAELSRQLEACEGNVARAAVAMGIHITTLYRRMQRLGIAPPRKRAGRD